MKEKQAIIRISKAIFITAFVFLSFIAFSQNNNFRFKHLNVSNGISNNNVQSILQDYEGFMWFGTSNGLNKYDGYKCKVYKHDSRLSTSLVSSEISKLYEDNQRNLWVGTLSGLCRYQKDKDFFVRYPEVGPQPITAVKEDNKNNLFVCSGSAIYLYNRNA